MKFTIIVLSVLLFVSNGAWLISNIDTGITSDYQAMQIHELEETKKQLMAMLPEVAAEKQFAEVVASASKHSSEEPFEKNGCTWVGWLGLKSDGVKLTRVVSVFSYQESEPCHTQIG